MTVVFTRRPPLFIGKSISSLLSQRQENIQSSYRHILLNFTTKMSSILKYNTNNSVTTASSSSSPLSITTGPRTDIPNQSSIDFSSSSGEQDEMTVTKGPWTVEVKMEFMGFT